MENVRKMTETITKDRDKAMERIREVADTAWVNGRKTWDEIRDQGQDALEQVQKSTQVAWEDTQKLVQKHPAEAVGLAFFVGALIGGAWMAMRRNV
jgi:ElaB/YqjD/DUF883 family membrane-anchored ribosome-binding protein